MPYYVFNISQPNQMIKHLELHGSFEAYQDAKAKTRELRSAAEPGDRSLYKMVFASSQLEAEERLHETREKPILMEWEK